MARVITHRGYKGVLRDNSVTGIMLAVFKNKFCEFDVLYVEGVWKVCHDFGALNPYSTNLAELMAHLKANRQRILNNIIVDVKWDWVWNRIDDLGVAIKELKAVLLSVGGDVMLPLWVQASGSGVLRAMREHGFADHWKVGMIVVDAGQLARHQGQIDYAMIPLHDFSPEDVEKMSGLCELIGFTCRKPDQLPLYKHLFPFLHGIVCDVSV